MGQLPKDKAGPLARYVATIQSQRGDYNGRVLSIRQEDLRSLAVIYDKSPIDLTEELISWGVLDSEARAAYDTLLRANYPIDRWERPLGELAATAGPDTVVIFAEPFSRETSDITGPRHTWS